MSAVRRSPAFAALFVILAVWSARSAADEPPQKAKGKFGGGGSAGVYRDRVTPHWFANETKFWYRNDLKGGTKEFVLVDAEKGSRGPAFDHAKLAASLSKAAGTEYAANKLPFDDVTFVNEGKSVRFKVGAANWTCDLTTYDVEQTSAPEVADNPSPTPPLRREGLNPAPPSLLGKGDGGLGSDDGAPDPAAPAPQRPQKGEARSGRSPDGTWTAFVKDHNLHLRDADGKETALTTNGKDGLAYDRPIWSPDSKALVAFRTEPGDRKPVHRIESSPKAGGRAVIQSSEYPLPGDKFTSYEPHLFDVAAAKEVKLDVETIDFGFPVIRWGKDGGTFTYRKVDRGHQRLRLVEIDARTGTSRHLIDEKTDTFIWTNHYDAFTFPVVTWLAKTDEIVYVSEKSGWRHLHLIDAKTGAEKNDVTPGEYVVRGVESIDEEHRQVWFRASGKHADQDPYFVHFYRVNFDGTGLVPLTEGNGTHTVQFSPGRKYLVDTYSRVDMAPVTELRRASDGQLVCQLEEADVADLKANGWKPPEVFSAKGRDGKTDVWGVIVRPRDFDPTKKYPVIESIYAGPQGSFTPKAFSPFNRYAGLTDLGFVVVQMDGMGTANRSKAFHDVCWKNLKDAGFPDRILWHKAVAAKYPWYDTSRVGIYGTSAGGQNAMGALLFHGDFYKAAMAACGCHDNRMDKASWNEQWMGYPVGPQYAACSNVDNAHKLTGKLLLIVGELDTNVPPESTMRVVDALIKANKDFELVVVPGMGHSNGGAYGTRRMNDFFVRHLQGKEPPDRNAAPADKKRKGADGARGGEFEVRPGVGWDKALRRPTTRAYEVGASAPPGVPTGGGTAPSLVPPYESSPTATAAGDDVPVAPPPRLKLPLAPAPREALDFAPLLKKPSEAAPVVRRFDADRGSLQRTYFESERGGGFGRSSRPLPLDTDALARMDKFYADWLAALKEVNFDKVSSAARDELLSLRARIETERKEMHAQAGRAEAVAPLLPFAETVLGLESARRRMDAVDSPKAAGQLDALKKQVAKVRAAAEAALKTKELAPGLSATKAAATQAATAVGELRAALRTWHQFYDGYDPLFTWWTAEPYKQADAALDGYAKFLTDKAKTLPDGSPSSPPATVRTPTGPSDAPDVAALLASPQSELGAVVARSGGFGGRGGPGRGGPPSASDRDPAHVLAALRRLDFAGLSREGQVDYLLLKARLERDVKRAELQAKGDRRPPVPKDDTGIVGRPIGRDALMVELAGELIPYSPEELIALARKELEWCDAEVLKASREMGFGDDWRAATEKVKTRHVPPGGQPKLIRELSDEAIAYLRANDLVTVPPLADETWRMMMMTPERQRFSPFFTGGEVISVAFPTQGMSHDAKLQSLRGNNIHFARATVHHELIPGHHLQQFMNSRYQPHRGAFSTPFWTEGWALYWEFVLYEKGFPKAPEDRIGFLTWRKHRCCRVMFSLGYHMGTMTPRQCIDLLTDRVGFEPENAAAEVRRSFVGGYPPLYQAAYLVGGWQFWALRKELVGSGKMTDRQFHDAILAEHAMPVAMVRAAIRKEPLTPEVPAWKFAGEVDAKAAP